MSKNHRANPAASNRQKLLNYAKANGRLFDEVLRQFALERFLARVARSEMQSRLILKGAQMIRIWSPEIQRPTMDLDFLASTSNDLRKVESWVRDLCEMEDGPEPDGLCFDAESIQTSIIKEEADYHGVRVLFSATLDLARVRIQLDLGFDDIVSPEPEAIKFPTLLHHTKPCLQGYTRESAIAEKLHAMVILELLNSRMKDFYDILLLSRTQTFSQTLLRKAVENTFAQRETAVPTELPILLRETHPVLTQKQTQWVAFVRKNKLDQVPTAFDEVAKELRTFVAPILQVATEANEQSWSPDRGWKL